MYTIVDHNIIKLQRRQLSYCSYNTQLIKTTYRKTEEKMKRLGHLNICIIYCTPSQALLSKESVVLVDFLKELRETGVSFYAE